MKTAIKNIFSCLCGIAEIALVYFLIGHLIGFAIELIDANYKNKPENESITYSYEYQEKELDPYFYDEYGIRYDLDEDSDGEYYISESQEIEIDTPDSSAFTHIGYLPYYRTLWVVFRNTGACYNYYDVPPEVWYEFKNADSKGGYFQEAIRGYYEYDRD